MAVEVAAHNYLYVPIMQNPRGLPTGGGIRHQMDKERRRARQRGQDVGTGMTAVPQLPTIDEAGGVANVDKVKISTPFRHNPLHDLESILWLALYMLLCSDLVKKDSSITEEDWNQSMDAHGRLAAKFFTDKEYRARALGGEVHFEESLDTLLPEAQSVMLKLNQMRGLIVTRYHDVEQHLDKNSSIRSDVAADICPMIKEILWNVTEYLRKNNFEIKVDGISRQKRILNEELVAKNVAEDVPAANGPVDNPEGHDDVTKRLAGLNLSPNNATSGTPPLAPTAMRGAAVSLPTQLDDGMRRSLRIPGVQEKAAEDARTQTEIRVKNEMELEKKKQVRSEAAKKGWRKRRL